jgi:hypothetical protein
LQKVINSGTRTHNPQIRSLVRYPLRHADFTVFYLFYNLLKAFDLQRPLMKLIKVIRVTDSDTQSSYLNTQYSHEFR